MPGTQPLGKTNPDMTTSPYVRGQAVPARETCPAPDMMVDVLKAHFHGMDNPYVWCHFHGIAPDPQERGYSNRRRSYGAYREPDEHVVAFFGETGKPITHWLAPFQTPSKTAHDHLKKERHIQTAQNRITTISAKLQAIMDRFDTIVSFTLIISPMLSSPKLYINYTGDKETYHFYGGRVKEPY